MAERGDQSHGERRDCTAHLIAWDAPRFNEVTTAIDGDGILLVTLNRPDRLNAFTRLMAAELMAVFEDANADDRVRAVILTGHGRAFCAGMELGGEGNVFGIDERKQPRFETLRAGLADQEQTEGVLDLGGRLTRTISRCVKPVAAAINGAAVGIGATMTLAADFRLAADGAKIGFVFNRIGIVPEACSTFFLPQLVGQQQALEWLYLAEPISAPEALKGRLLRSTHTPETLLPAAFDLMRQLTRGRSPLAQAMTRQLVCRAQDDRILAAHLRESLAMHWLSQRDGKEGVVAFLEKRPAHFRGSPACNLPPDFESWFE